MPAHDSNEVQVHLQALSDLLRRRHRFDVAAQAALADLVDELNKALGSGALAHEPAGPLAESTAHFAEALHRADERAVLDAARDRLEEAVVKAEASAPGVAGLARRFMEALSNIGI